MPWWILAALYEAILLRLVFWGDLRGRAVETILLTLAAGALYACAVYLGVRRGSGARVMLGAALLFRITAWPLFPALSDDVFRYRWEGQVQAEGGNPYGSRPADPEWSHLRDAAWQRIPGHDFRAVYGPLQQLVQRGMYGMAAVWTDDPFRQAFWMKLPAAVFDLATIGLLLVLVRQRGLPDAQVAVYAWCPLPVLEFWGNGHNDALALFFLVLALVSVRASGIGLGLGAAIATKLWPLAVAPLFVTRKTWRGLIAGALPVLLLLMPFRDIAWSTVWENLRFTTGFVGGWRNNDSLFGALLWIAGGDLYLAKKLAFAGAGAALAVALWKRWPIERGALTVLAVLLLVSANCHPWYLIWMLPFLTVLPVPWILLWICLAPLGHAAVIGWHAAGEWNGSTPIRWFLYAPVSVFFLLTVLPVLVQTRSVLGPVLPGRRRQGPSAPC
ncbi:MAG: DUF2029 domain-containing protein [Bryobacterales bacterium]|nr:DUF2029 domain-containing protein [Bryobacterales bacterium]